LKVALNTIKPNQTDQINSSKDKLWICLITFNDVLYWYTADDEQSDFFHEPGPACGIPGIIPWWENESKDANEMESDKEFQQLLTGTFENMSKSSQLAFKARVTKLMAKVRISLELSVRNDWLILQYFHLYIALHWSTCLFHAYLSEWVSDCCLMPT